MSIPSIPNSFKLDPVNITGGLDVDLKLEGPDGVLNIDLGLNDIKADLGLNDIKADLGLDNVKVDLGLDKVNACVSLAIKEVPPLRIQIPNNYKMGFEFLGIPIFAFTLCGKTMLLTEDNPTRFFREPGTVVQTPRIALKDDPKNSTK